jgi:hypothetical protein
MRTLTGDVNDKMQTDAIYFPGGTDYFNGLFITLRSGIPICTGANRNLSSPTMKQPDSNGIDVMDMFHIAIGELPAMWGLSEKELEIEMRSGRLVIKGKPEPGGGYSNLQAYLPDLRNWVARKREMPARVRAKVEAAGGLDRVEQWRVEQFNLCEIDLEANRLKLPDGTILSDLTLWPRIAVSGIDTRRSQCGSRIPHHKNWRGTVRK